MSRPVRLRVRRWCGRLAVVDRILWFHNLTPSPTVLLVSLDGFAVFGSDLILLCTTSTRLVFDNVQNLRRVRVPSLLRVCVILTSPVS